MCVKIIEKKLKVAIFVFKKNRTRNKQITRIKIICVIRQIRVISVL